MIQSIQFSQIVGSRNALPSSSLEHGESLLEIEAEVVCKIDAPDFGALARENYVRANNE